jgi:hypothetical protein
MNALITNSFFIVVLLLYWGMHLGGHRHPGHGHGQAGDGEHV